uniref:Transcription regulator protein n=1 Tax=Mycobacterium phage L1 TaxID=164125 RepID=Q8H9H0_9VIRU|nr:transcription regulator protein [Mycobacterium phage L1]
MAIGRRRRRRRRGWSCREQRRRQGNRQRRYRRRHRWRRKWSRRRWQQPQHPGAPHRAGEEARRIQPDPSKTREENMQAVYDSFKKYGTLDGFIEAQIALNRNCFWHMASFGIATTWIYQRSANTRPTGTDDESG